MEKGSRDEWALGWKNVKADDDGMGRDAGAEGAMAGKVVVIR